MIELSKIKPMKGLAICASFDFELKLARTSIFNLQSCRYELHGEQWSGFSPSDSEPVLLGIETACRFAIANNYKGKVYVSDLFAFGWGRGYKPYHGSFDSQRVEQILVTLKQHKFGQRIWFWPWGKIEKHVEKVLATEAIGREFFNLCKKK